MSRGAADERNPRAAGPRPGAVILFGIKFLLVAALLLYLYSGVGLGLGEPYLRLQGFLARPILTLLGSSPDPLLGGREARGHGLRNPSPERVLELGRAKYYEMAATRDDLGLPLVTYIALILATPTLAWRRRLRILGAGLGILVLSHVPTLAVLFLEILSRLQGHSGLAGFHGGLADVLNIFSEILPFLLWLLLVPIRLPAFLLPGGGART